MWRVIALDKDGREVTRVDLASGEVTIGRDPDRQIQLASASVSRRHARLIASNGQVLVADDGSANGIIVNGTRIAAPTPVDARARIEIAEFRIIVESLQPEAQQQPIGSMAPPTSAVVESVRLVAQGGPFDGRVVPVIGEVMVGRAAENQLVLDDPSLSRKHARLRGQGRRLELEDLGSSNGTFVNGRKVGRAQAVPGDTVRFGELTFRVEDERGQGRPAGELHGGLLIGLVGGGAATFVIVLVAIVVAVRKRPQPPPARDAIQKITRQAEQHLRAGKQLFADKKWSDAKIELESTIELDPANVEARRLKALATRAPEDERNVTTATAAIAIGDRRGLETALRLRDELPLNSPERVGLDGKLETRLLQLGAQQFDARSWADAQWGYCRAFEVDPKVARRDPRASRDIKDAEKKLGRSSAPCRAAR
jgi:pSer/pThr/pTyr-binding forkhead associated (FHA) protein